MQTVRLHWQSGMTPSAAFSQTPSPSPPKHGRVPVTGSGSHRAQAAPQEQNQVRRLLTLAPLANVTNGLQPPRPVDPGEKSLIQVNVRMREG